MLSPGSPKRSSRAKSRSWPPEVAEYLQDWILEPRSPAFLVSDPEGKVAAKGGDLSRYGLDNLREGDDVTEQAYFLEGYLPLDSPISLLSQVETASGRFADIHLFQIPDGDCIVLLDCSQEVAERAHIEQALRQTEEHLRQAEKMEALGRLAGGVAHDFNNLLTVILGYGQLLSDSLTDEKLRSAAREIVKAANRAASMTRQLLSFSRRQPRHVEILDLNDVVCQFQDPLRRLIGEDIELTVDLAPSLGFVEADRGQIEQVLINLTVNARDAMPKGGPLKIRTANVRIDAPGVKSRTIPFGPYVSMSVSDQGCGMDAETRARAFEPFFTSKESGRGTGFGLSIVYGIVIQSGGEIILNSEVGQGTDIEILLPAVDRTPAATHATSEDAPARGTGTVLVVEDDGAVRKLLCSILTQLGYSVLETADASTALELSRCHPARIDLLVTDIVMPQRNGPDLAADIVAAHPETRVLYVSGYAEESLVLRGIALSGNAVLTKPFTPGLLANRVREALNGPPGV
jgi:two-component system cell cycle sensor histidine kinase/response regulator CckA